MRTGKPPYATKNPKAAELAIKLRKKGLALTAISDEMARKGYPIARSTLGNLLVRAGV